MANLATQQFLEQIDLIGKDNKCNIDFTETKKHLQKISDLLSTTNSDPDKTYQVMIGDDFVNSLNSFMISISEFSNEQLTCLFNQLNAKQGCSLTQYQSDNIKKAAILLKKNENSLSKLRGIMEKYYSQYNNYCSQNQDSLNSTISILDSIAAIISSKNSNVSVVNEYSWDTKKWLSYIIIIGLCVIVSAIFAFKKNKK